MCHIVTGHKSKNSNGYSLEFKVLFDTFSFKKKYYFFSVPYWGATFRFLMEKRKMPRNSAATTMPMG